MHHSSRIDQNVWVLEVLSISTQEPCEASKVASSAHYLELLTIVKFKIKPMVENET